MNSLLWQRHFQSLILQAEADYDDLKTQVQKIKIGLTGEETYRNLCQGYVFLSKDILHIERAKRQVPWLHTLIAVRLSRKLGKMKGMLYEVLQMLQDPDYLGEI